MESGHHRRRVVGVFGTNEAVKGRTQTHSMLGELLETFWSEPCPLPVNKRRALPHDPWSRAPYPFPRYFPLCSSWKEHIQEHVLPMLLRTAPECNIPLARLTPLLCLRGTDIAELPAPALGRIHQIETSLGMSTLTDWRDRVGAEGGIPPPKTASLLLYKHLSPEDRQDGIYRTLQYMYFQMRSGILVRIERGRVRLFVPFFNADPGAHNLWDQRANVAFRIRNTQLNDPAIEASVKTYYAQKQREWPESKRDDEGFLPHPRHWWANAYMVDNVPQPFHWSDHWNYELKSMLDATAERYHVMDCTFFLNKRDFPYLHYQPGGLREPYPYLYQQRDELPLYVHNQLTVTEEASMAPICSFAGGEMFADLLMPPVDDWLQANGCGPLKPSARLPPWDKRESKAVFRGGSTGRGVTAKTNPRWALVVMAKDHPTLFDCALTSWCLRDRVVVDTPQGIPYLAHPAKTDTKGVRCGKQHYLTYEEQARFKFVVYVEGHVAAYRYGVLMQMGSCILRIRETSDAPKLWFTDKLVGYKITGKETEETTTNADHIGVDAVSDLPEVMAWCVRNDRLCAQIAQNAGSFAARWLSREAILAYWWNLLQQIHNNQYKLLTHLVPVVLEPEIATHEVSPDEHHQHPSRL